MVGMSRYPSSQRSACTQAMAASNSAPATRNSRRNPVMAQPTVSVVSMPMARWLPIGHHTSYSPACRVTVMVVESPPCRVSEVMSTPPGPLIDSEWVALPALSTVSWYVPGGTLELVSAMEKSFSVAVRVPPAVSDAEPDAPPEAEPDVAAEEVAAEEVAAEEVPPEETAADVLSAAADPASLPESLPQAANPSTRTPAPTPAASRETEKVRTGPPGVEGLLLL